VGEWLWYGNAPFHAAPADGWELQRTRQTGFFRVRRVQVHVEAAAQLLLQGKNASNWERRPQQNQIVQTEEQEHTRR